MQPIQDGPLIENPLLLFVFVMANVLITCGYIYLAVQVVPRVRVTLRRTKIGGIGFFLLCAGTHLDMAYHALFYPGKSIQDMFISPEMLAIHVPQAVAVWLFVTGLYVEVGNWRREGQAPARSAEDT